jgi:hypothetical protein
MELSRRCAALLLSALLVGPAPAHHSYAEYDLSQFLLIEGRVAAWRLNNPHSSLELEALDEAGDMQTWHFEGASRVFALMHGISDRTFSKGDRIKVVINPVRTGERAGAMCFGIKADEPVFPLNDGTCNAAKVVETWKSQGWLDSTTHLGLRPARPGS